MRTLATLLTVLAMAGLLVTDLSAQLLQDPDELPKKYRKWLEEEVVYIITEEERDGFLQLTSNELRDKFIDHFWEIRDPTPGTRANEFKIEHYERIEYANKYYGVRSAQNGWRSDRGRYHILLGKPKQRSEYPNNTLVYPAELWFYQVPKGTTGAVNFFYLIFFRKSGAGDYVLYHPVLDGPQSLTWKGNFDISDSEVMQAIQGLDTELAIAAQGYDPMNPGNALASEVLIGQIDAIPENTIDDSWVQKFLDTKGEVLINYSFVPLELNVPIALHTELDGSQYVHYGFSLDPGNIDAGQHDDRFYIVFEVIPSLADMDGNVIYEQTKTAEMNWDVADFQSFGGRSLMITDFFPVVPGNYTFTLRVRNKVSKKFYLHTQPLRVVDPASADFALTPLTLHHSYEQSQDEPSKITPFRFFTVNYQPSDLNMFTKEDKIYLFTELHFPEGANGEKKIGEITFTFNVYDAGNEAVKKLTHIIPEDKVNEFGIVYMSRQIVLSDLDLGTYRLEVTASEAKNGFTSKQEKEFIITVPEKILRPTNFVLRSKEAINEQERMVVRAIQLKNSGQFEEATKVFEKILSYDPTHLEAALNYGTMLYEDLEQPAKAIEVTRAVSRKEPNNIDLVRLLAKCAEAIEDWKLAAGYYERLIFVDGNNYEDLNNSAKVSLKTGNKERARERLKRSLKINPEQPEISALLEEIKE